MVGLDNIVEVLHLPVPRLIGAFTLGLELRDGGGVGRRLVGIQHLGLLPILQPVQRLAEESLRGLGVARRREIEIDRVSKLVERTVQREGDVYARRRRRRRTSSTPSQTPPATRARSARFMNTHFSLTTGPKPT